MGREVERVKMSARLDVKIYSESDLELSTYPSAPHIHECEIAHMIKEKSSKKPINCALMLDTCASAHITNQPQLFLQNLFYPSTTKIVCTNGQQMKLCLSSSSIIFIPKYRDF